MRKIILSFVQVIALGSLLFLNSCDKDDDPVVTGPFPAGPNVTFYALIAGTQLAKINATNPQTILSAVNITGLQPNEKILSIDFRPATGQLYGVGSTSRLYLINLNGTARAIGTAPFSPALSSAFASIDFNPTVDRIRLVTLDGLNLRLNPETGTVVATDGAINGATNSAIGAVAYTGNTAGSTSTVLFDIDVNNDKLYKQDPPNNGTLVEVGPLNFNVSVDAGFDISPDGTAALAVLGYSGKPNLFTIDLTTGAATRLGPLAGSSAFVADIAIPTNPVAFAIDNSNNLLIFNLNTPGTPVNKPITGLPAGEMIVGLDFRPVNAQLYALGNTSRIYAINTSNGAAVMIGTGPFTPALTGTSFGFDFNPTVDRIRIVGNTGQNLRVHPETGVAVTPADGNLNPGTPAVSAAAYTNNFAGATATSLFVIDATTDKLYLQNPPNNGTLVEIGSLGINVELANGFDIGGTSNMAYALLTVGGATKVYSINLSTGAATAVADFPAAARALAIGTGF